MLLGKQLVNLALAAGTALRCWLRRQYGSKAGPAGPRPQRSRPLRRGSFLRAPGRGKEIHLHRGPQQVQGTAAGLQERPEVTKACLACHTEAAKQVMHTKH